MGHTNKADDPAGSAAPHRLRHGFRHADAFQHRFRANVGGQVHDPGDARRAAPGSKVTVAPLTHAGASARNGASSRTRPVNHAAGQGVEAVLPLRVIIIGFSCAGWVSGSNYSLGDLADGEGRINGDMVLDRDTFGGVLKNRFTIARCRIAAGVDLADNDYGVDNYGDHSSAQPRRRDFSTLQLGTFVQGRFDFANGFDLSTGLRYDHQRFEDWNRARFSASGASANATLSYRFNDLIEVFAGASHSWMGCDVGEYGLRHARDAAFATDPDYQPATAKNDKIGVNAGGAHWKAGLTFFDTRLDRLNGCAAGCCASASITCSTRPITSAAATSPAASEPATPSPSMRRAGRCRSASPSRSDPARFAGAAPRAGLSGAVTRF